MGTIDTTLQVYFSKDKAGNLVLLSFPNDDIVVPPATKATVTWKAVSSPSGAFAQPPQLDNVMPYGTDATKIKILTTAFPTTMLVAEIDNSAGGTDFDAGIKFKSKFGTGTNPPVVTGGGTIRNKGTSIAVIFTREVLIASLISLVIGVLITAVVMRSHYGAG